MELKPGAKLGPYEILSRLGEGGMGQVWKARDTRLDRVVAIKTSHKRFSDRFEREAHAVAALNHPHICTLYDVGPDYLVMEYVDGPEIKGPLPLEQTLKLAIQLASALEAAHKKSITHRDLKPANILTTKSGVKVLDFGLAKIEQSRAAAANDETLTRALTQEGAIVGTLQYMAPEQLQAKPTDARADIFSFGCVLYEMLAGKRAFDGANTASVIAAVLEREPPSVAGIAPASLDWLLKRCLAKDPEERWQTATDLRAALGRIEVIAEEARAKRPSRAPLIAWGITALAVAAAATLAVLHYREKPTEIPVSKLFLNPPEKTRFVDVPPTVSPDGREIVFGAVSEDGKTQLWLRPLDSLTAQPLAGTEGATYPFWSPDSQSIAFFSGGKLRKLSLPGGSPVTLADTPDARGGSWSRNDVIVFVPSPYGGVVQISTSGGVARAVLPPDAAHARRFPAFLPDGKHFVFLESTFSASDNFLRVASLDSSSSATLLPDAVDSFGVYAQGNLLFLRGDTLVARPFDEKKLAFTGNAIPVAERVQNNGLTLNLGRFSASDEGLIVYRTETLNRRLTWFDRSGKRLDGVGDAGDISMIRLSPDRRTVAAAVRDVGDNFDIWLYNVPRGVRSRFTFDPAWDIGPVWMPDGRTVIFRSDRNGVGNIFRKPADGSRNEEPLYVNDRIKTPWNVSRDGKYLAFTEQEPKSGQDIWILPDPGGPVGASKPYPFLQTDFNETNPAFSPDGHWLAYQSDESGRNEVYVTPFPGPGGKRQVSTAGGNTPIWRPDGKELFYVAAGQLMAAEVGAKGGDFEVNKVTPLFRLASSAWDVSADGQRFLVAAPPEGYQGEPITVVRNWIATLKK